MRKICIINQKGGVGKTTLALHLATAFHHHRHNTVLLDLDPQSSASEWYDSRLLLSTSPMGTGFPFSPTNVSWLTVSPLPARLPTL